MNTAGMVLGIIGGLIALLVGAFGYGLSSMGASVSASVGYHEGSALMMVYQFASLALPIAALVGSGVAVRAPAVGGVIMAASAIGIVFVFGFGFFSTVPVVLLGVGALLVFLGLSNSAEGATGETDRRRNGGR